MLSTNARNGAVNFRDIKAERIRLNGDRVLVKVDDIDNIVPVGDFFLELPQGSVDEKSLGFVVGRVVAMGDGHRLERDETVRMFAKIGDRVICERYAGREVKLADGDRYRIYNQVDVLGVVDEE